MSTFANLFGLKWVLGKRAHRVAVLSPPLRAKVHYVISAGMEGWRRRDAGTFPHLVTLFGKCSRCSQEFVIILLWLFKKMCLLFLETVKIWWHYSYASRLMTSKPKHSVCAFTYFFKMVLNLRPRSVSRQTLTLIYNCVPAEKQIRHTLRTMHNSNRSDIRKFKQRWPKLKIIETFPCSFRTRSERQGF